MADTKISNLTALAAAPDSGDFFAVVDTSATATKKLDAKYIVRDSAGTGAIVTGAYTLTIPATGTAALLGAANIFTASQIIRKSSTGASAASTADSLVLESTTSSGITILTNNTQNANIFFADTDLNTVGGITYQHATDTFGFVQSGSTRMRITGNGVVLIGTSTDNGPVVQIKQASTTAAIPVLRLEQSDDDIAFIDYVGTTAASAAKSLSSWTTGNTVQGHARIRVNGTTRWIRFYDAPTS